MENDQKMPPKVRGMKYFGYLCIVNGVLGTILSIAFFFAFIGFILMYTDYAVLCVCGCVGFFAAIVFYIARIVCYLRYSDIGVYPRWLFWGMSFTLWYGWDCFFMMCAVSCWSANEVSRGFFFVLVCFLPLINQFYLLRRRHLFVFDRSRLVYLAPKEKQSTQVVPRATQQTTCVHTLPRQNVSQIQQKAKEEHAMITIGQRVKHHQYGVGTVQQILQDCILINFGVHQKMFKIPDAFFSGILHAIPAPVGDPITAFDTTRVKEPVEKYKTVSEALHAASIAVQPVWVEQGIPGNMQKEQGLAWRHYYGSKGMDVYIQGCDLFGWDKNLSGHFGMMKDMYAKKGAVDEKSIWMLPHHQWIMPIANKPDCMWWNTITSDTVFEEWKEPMGGFYTDFTERITFAKSKDGYVFIGVFKPVEILEGIGPDGLMHYVKVYHLVQKNYNG